MITRLLAAGIVLAILAWAGGLAWFAGVAGAPGGPVAAADGIVVLTGGSNRIDEGLRLLSAGRAPRLLVSGVLPGTAVARLAREAGVDPAQLAGRVTLGQSAISTRGNAEETVEWVRRYDLRSLVVVTAFYHMPRALAELRRALPGVALQPYPVLPDGSAQRRLVLLVTEYTKWLFVELGLSYPGVNRRPGEGLK